MSGLSIFPIRTSAQFQRSYKKLLKRYYKGDKAKGLFIDFIDRMVKGLSEDPFRTDSLAERWPGGLAKPEEWEFRKYYFDMPSLGGASGEGRLMYLVNTTQRIILLLWLYTHDQFEKRPPDRSLKQLLQELIESQSASENSSSADDEDSDSRSSADE